MKKVLKFLSIVLVSILLVGCDKKTSSTEPVKDEKEPNVEVSKLKEGKYTQIAPSNNGTEGAGYDNYLTLENGKAIKFDSYYEITTEGTYTLEDNIVTVTYTRTYGVTTYGEKYDDPYNAVYTYHIEDNKVILDKMSDFDLYETGSVIYELK